MKKYFISKPVFAIILIILLPILLAATTTTTTKKAKTPPPAQPALQGYVKNSTTGLDKARVRSITDGFETCSQSSPLGWYSFQLATGGDKKVTYIKQGFRMYLATILGLGIDEIRQLNDVILANPTPAREITGYVGVAREGITVKLYQIGCVDTLIAQTKTCSDGKYSFYGILNSDATAVNDIPDGTYRVEPSCSVCTFTANFTGNIQVPVTPSGTKFDFTASCTPGACQ